jgi:hypothetical protein
MVAVAREAEQGQQAVCRLETGTNLRVCASDACLASAEEGMLPEDYRAGHHGREPTDLQSCGVKKGRASHAEH